MKASRIAYTAIWIVWFLSTISWMISFGMNDKFVPFNESVLFLIAFVSSSIICIHHTPMRENHLRKAEIEHLKFKMNRESHKVRSETFENHKDYDYE